MTGQEFNRLMRGLARELGVMGKVECLARVDDEDGSGVVVHVPSGHILAYYVVNEIVVADGPITASDLIKRMERRMREALWQPVKCFHCGDFHEQPDALEQVEACLRKKGAKK